jgi:hypothetical protein
MRILLLLAVLVLVLFAPVSYGKGVIRTTVAVGKSGVSHAKHGGAKAAHVGAVVVRGAARGAWRVIW